PAARLREADGPVLGTLAEFVTNTREPVRPDRSRLLAPVDLQVIKAAGVTFPVSMLERLIEERIHGDATAAAAVREEMAAVVGGSLADLVPGSAEADTLRRRLQERGWWSQYLEVGIGTDAEVFTK